MTTRRKEYHKKLQKFNGAGAHSAFNLMLLMLQCAYAFNVDDVIAGNHDLKSSSINTWTAFVGLYF